VQKIKLQTRKFAKFSLKMQIEWLMLTALHASE